MLIAVVLIRGERVLIAAEGILQGYLGRRSGAERYAECLDPPHYPVPALREWYEFGWNLSKNEPSLIHVHSGVYDA